MSSLLCMCLHTGEALSPMVIFHHSKCLRDGAHPKFLECSCPVSLDSCYADVHPECDKLYWPATLCKYQNRHLRRCNPDVFFRQYLSFLRLYSHIFPDDVTRRLFCCLHVDGWIIIKPICLSCSFIGVNCRLIQKTRPLISIG